MSIQLNVLESGTNIDVTIVEDSLSVVFNPSAPQLENIPDVAVANLQDGDTLLFDSVDGLWRNAPPAAASGNIDGGTFF